LLILTAVVFGFNLTIDLDPIFLLGLISMTTVPASKSLVGEAVNAEIGAP
jgi:hypothetical protein